MEEIRVNDYVRTENGEIFKLLGDQVYLDCHGEEVDFVNDIKNHSPNIIDLIEVDDYVNGYKVRATYLDGEKHYIKLDVLDDIRVYDENIKNVATHEQFNSMKYEVE